jgi:serine protease inhibitor
MTRAFLDVEEIGNSASCAQQGPPTMLLNLSFRQVAPSLTVSFSFLFLLKDLQKGCSLAGSQYMLLNKISSHWRSRTSHSMHM